MPPCFLIFDTCKEKTTANRECESPSAAAAKMVKNACLCVLTDKDTTTFLL